MGAYANETQHKTISETLFGKDLKSGKAWSIFALRMSLGFVFLWAGYEKIYKELNGSGMQTTGFLAHVGGPFAFLFNGMSGNPAVDFLLVGGEFAIGLSLMVGIFTRLGGASGALMTLLLYMSTLPVLPAGYAGSYLDYLMWDKNNALVSYYIIYILVFVAFVFLVPGRFLGADGVLQNAGFVERRPTLRRILKTLG